MKVENITNYGKGFFEHLPEIDKLKRRIMIPIVKVLFREMGPIKTLVTMWRVRDETKKLKSHDWTDFEKKHGFRKEDISKLLEDFVLMKVMMEMMGEEKAMEIVGAMLEEGNAHIARKSNQNLMMMPVEELKSLKDSFAGFKEYVTSIEKAVEQDGVHEFHIVEDTHDSFAFDIKYCIMHEIAKELGNIKYCFMSCHADDVVFPQIGPELGFQYTRSGSLGCGASYCDFRFKRT